MNKIRAEFVFKTAPILGISEDDAFALLRKAQTLHTWAVHECNGTIQREDDGRCYWYNPNTGNRCGRTTDRETGAVKAVHAIANRYGLKFEHQGDPRGWVVRLWKDGREYGVPSRG